MSRAIVRFARNGYITNTDGYYYRVMVSADGMSIVDRYMFGRNRTEMQISTQVGRLGGDMPPSHLNGWTVTMGIGQCPLHPAEAMLKDRFYGGQNWRAIGVAGRWQAHPIGTDAERNAHCGLTVGRPDLNPPDDTGDSPNETIYPPSEWASTPIIENIDWRIALAVTLAVVALLWWLLKYKVK